jgi:hypothetical protein
MPMKRLHTLHAAIAASTSEMPSESTYKQNYEQAKAEALSDQLAQKL